MLSFKRKDKIMAKQQHIPQESKLLHEKLRQKAVQRRMAMFHETNALTDLFGDDAGFDEQLEQENFEEADRIGMKAIGLSIVTLFIVVSVMLLSGASISMSTAIIVGAISTVSLLFGLYFIDRSVSLRNSFSWRETSTLVIMGTTLMTSLIYGFVITSLTALAV